MNTRTLALAAAILVLAAAMPALAQMNAPAASDNDPLSAISTHMSCPAVSSIIELGAANRQADVLRLQAFLAEHEGAAIEPTGSYDLDTQAAVVAFQKKYASDILGPWGATRASGIVGLTTMKKVNELACGIPLSLSAGELQAIADWNARHSTGATMAQNAPSSGGADITTAGNDQLAGAAASNEDSAASAGTTTIRLGGGSLVARFFKYLAGWF